MNFCSVDVDSGTNMGMVLLCLKQMFSYRDLLRDRGRCVALHRTFFFLHSLPSLSSSTHRPPMWVFSKVQDYTQAPEHNLPKSEEETVAREPESTAAVLRVCLLSKGQTVGPGPCQEWTLTVQGRRARALLHSLGPRRSQTRLVRTH